MKTPTQQNFTSYHLPRLFLAIILALMFVAPAIFAASQTWTNAPQDNTWTNVNNWNGKAVPGDINVATANTVNGDNAIFTNALSGGIGGAANPILPDDATVVNGRSRRILGMIFDTTDCGPYVFYSPSPEVAQNGGSPATGILYVSHNGSIVMSNPVVNSQVIAIPLYVNLPSSTAGIFNLINNSTNPTATLTIKSITHAGATTRATTYFLGGVNTGNNVVTNLSEGGGNATGGFTKQGPGTWIIAGPGTFLGASPMNINDGTLAVQDPGAFGAATTANIVSNGILRIDGVNLTTATLALRNGGTIRMNGSATINAVSVNNAAATSVTLATTSAGDVMSLGTVANTPSGGAVDTLIHIAGPGTVLLNQNATYLGRWSVDAGTNQISNASALAGANLNISAGGVFDVTPIGAGTYTVATKTFSASGTGLAVGSTAATIVADAGGTVDFSSKALTLTFTPSAFTGDSGHPALLAVQGTLSFNGNAITVNNASGTPLGAGTYQLVHQNSGSIVSSGGFVALVAGSGLQSGNIAEIVASGGNLNLVVSAYTPKSLVWKGGDPTLPNTWDRQTSVNWLNGATMSTYNVYDSVLFNATGSAQPNVILAYTLAPGSVVVDTSANNYTFSGAGQIAGGTSLVKISPGSLILQTANTYSGGTIISNGVVQLGIDEGISSTGAGDLALYSPAVFDLNNFSNTVNGFNGNGTVDITGGGTSTLVVGDNGNSGVFSGLIQNSSGTLGLFKAGTGTETLTASNSYVGPTTIDLGTLRVTNTYALGAGLSAVTINNGTLTMDTSLIVSNLNGNGGAVNNSSAATNLLTILGGGTNGSVISGKIRLFAGGGLLRLTGANTYSNGTFVAEGATFQIGNSVGTVVTGPLTASNNATLGLPGGSAPPGTPTSITTADGATVSFTSGAEGNSWGGQFIGSATATNRFIGPVSVGAPTAFSNFLGVVQIALASGNFRFFNGGGVNGGENTTFEFDAGNVHTRDAQTVLFGAIAGGSSAAGIGGNGTAGTLSTWIIGGKNIDCAFEGFISGSNNIVKSGSAKLILDGAIVTTNTDAATYTNYLYAPALTYLNNTVVSNGVLIVTVPNDLANSMFINVAATNAVLDTSTMGYITNFTDGLGNPNSALVTNGVLTIVANTPLNGTPQVLGGMGTVKGNGVINYGTINPGLAGAGGTLTISNGLAIMANATNYFDLSDDISGLVKPSDMINVQGNVVLSGGSVIGIGALNGNLKVGKYTLIKYSGSLINESGIVPPGPISNFSLGGDFAANSRATMVISNAPGEVDLYVVSLNNLNLTWTGDGVSNIWDVVDTYTWTNNSGPSQFYQMDNVTFDNTSNPTNNSVLLSGTLAPLAITVNSSTNFIFGGNGNIQGAVTLLKAGTGTLIMTNGANTYSGGTTLSNGVLNVGSDSGNNQNDLALGTGPVTVNSPAELRFGGNGGATVVNHFVTNSIIVNGGIVKAQDGAQHLTNSTVTITSAGGTFQTVFLTKNLILDSPVVGTGNLTISVPATFAGGNVIFANPSNTLSGNVTIATNGILALAGYAGLSNSPTITIQQGGVLDGAARTNKLWTVLSGQTLTGIGTLRGNITAASGSTLAPGGLLTIGTLTVSNLTTVTNTVTLGGTIVMDINRGATPNADRLVSTTNVFGGTLTVNNLGVALALGDSFQLFTSVTNFGAFAVTNLPALTTGLAWNNTLAINGKLTVVNVVNTNATSITMTFTNKVLTLTWPADHTGWRLQTQTNSLATGLGTNWVAIPGSETVNTTNITINPANGDVFYRLTYP